MDKLLEASRESAWSQFGRAVDELEETLSAFERSRYPGQARTDYSNFSLRRDNIATALKQIVDIRRRVHARHSDSLREDVEDILYLGRRAALNLGYFKSEFTQALAILEVETIELLYEAPKIVTPQLVVSVSDALLAAVAKSPTMLYEISPRQFEEIVAELFRKEGFEVELTQATRDGGVDIIAISRRMNISQKMIVECKRYAPENKVGIAVVQRLLGVKNQVSANKAIVVTTSSFTKEAQRVAHARFWDLDLKAYSDVLGWLQEASRQ